MKTWLSETSDLGVHALTGGHGSTSRLVGTNLLSRFPRSDPFLTVRFVQLQYAARHWVRYRP